MHLLIFFSCLYFTQQLCVPDWPFYNRHPVTWLESVPDRRQHIKSSYIYLGNRWLRNCSVFLRRCRQSQPLGVCMKAQSRGHSVDVQESNKFHFQINSLLSAGAVLLQLAMLVLFAVKMRSTVRILPCSFKTLEENLLHFAVTQVKPTTLTLVTTYRPAKSVCCH